MLLVPGGQVWDGRLAQGQFGRSEMASAGKASTERQDRDPLERMERLHIVERWSNSHRSCGLLGKVLGSAVGIPAPAALIASAAPESG